MSSDNRAFARVAALFFPEDPKLRSLVVTTDRSWKWDFSHDELGADMVAWGSGPATSMGGVAGLRSVFTRERSMERLIRKPPAPFAAARAHRLPPPLLRSGPRASARSFALSGVIIELQKLEGMRALDAVVRDSKITPDAVERLRFGSGGSVLLIDAATKQALRAGLNGTSADPRGAAGVLATLEASCVALVPRTLASGETSGIGWNIETLLPGARPQRLSRSLASSAATFCASLPRSPMPPASAWRDLDAVSVGWPRWSGVLHELTKRVDAAFVHHQGSVVHGDFWVGNLLAEEDALSGVVDWDASRMDGHPGVDLLHLIATDQRVRTRNEMGDVFATRPWASAEFTAAAAGYWDALGITPTAEFLDAVGVAWWATQVAAALRRVPELANDDRWVRANIDAVLDFLAETL